MRVIAALIGWPNVIYLRQRNSTKRVGLVYTARYRPTLTILLTLHCNLVGRGRLWVRRNDFQSLVSLTSFILWGIYVCRSEDFPTSFQKTCKFTLHKACAYIYKESRLKLAIVWTEFGGFELGKYIRAYEEYEYLFTKPNIINPKFASKGDWVNESMRLFISIFS